MKIALLGPAHPHRGGIVHFNSRLAEALRSRQELSVDLFYWSKPYPEFLMPGGIVPNDEASRLSFERPGKRFLSYTDPLSWWRLIRQLKQGRYDLFITHWVHPVHFPVLKSLFTAIRLFMKTEVGLIVHNSLPHERFAGDALITCNALQMAHRIVMHGRPEAAQAREIGVCRPKMITAFHPIYDQFPLPVESRETIRFELGLRARVLLFFGFIRPYKGLEILLAAFGRLAPRYPDLSLLLVGETFHGKREEAEKHDIFRHLSVADSVRSQIVWINRYVPNEAVGRYFTVADVLIVPYLSVTQSGPLTIAYAFDRPVIASDLPAFRDCVCEGESGHLFQVGNSLDLEDKIESFLKTPIAAQQIRHYCQQFSWDRYVNMLMGWEKL